MKVLSIFGTRPEAIKMTPVIRELHQRSEACGLQSVICVTAQHRQMLDQILNLFKIHPDIDLDLMEDNQSLASLTARAMSAITQVLEHVQPDLVLVQGDTTTAMVAALAAFYQKIPVGHIEAGLRTRNRYSPFPEEINRRLISVLGTYHFAPTRTAAEVLHAEGIPSKSIFVTGNTVIDALLWVVQQPPSQETCTLLGRLGIELTKDNKAERTGEDETAVRDRPTALPASRTANCGLRTILVTAHRRENFGQPMENLCRALREVVQRNPDVQVVYPVHMNPSVQEPVRRILCSHERLHLVEPLPYEPFVHLMKQAYLVLTDSGGIQEEAPALGVPVLVMRLETERPEGVEAGTVKIVGIDPDHIIAETERLLKNHAEYKRMAHTVSPYGDGHAAEYIVDIILGERLGRNLQQLGLDFSGQSLSTSRQGVARIAQFQPSSYVLQSSTAQVGAIAAPRVREPLLKRPLDLILSTLMLILSAPVSLLITLAIKLEDGRPIFYTQERWGWRRSRFKVRKFRTMVANADKKFGNKQAKENDPRVTQVGKLLRATGIDELPQLLSIWKGEMSFVGPRALAVDEILYDGNGNVLRYEEIPGFYERLSVRPGLTGIATVYKPKDIHPRDKFYYDLLYISNQSFWLDLRLIALSVWISFRGKWETRGRKV